MIAPLASLWHTHIEFSPRLMRSGSLRRPAEGEVELLPCCEGLPVKGSGWPPKSVFIGRIPDLKSGPDSGPQIEAGFRPPILNQYCGPDSGFQIGAGFRTSNRGRIPALGIKSIIKPHPRGPDSGPQIVPRFRPHKTIFRNPPCQPSAAFPPAPCPLLAGSAGASPPEGPKPLRKHLAPRLGR